MLANSRYSTYSRYFLVGVTSVITVTVAGVWAQGQGLRSEMMATAAAAEATATAAQQKKMIILHKGTEEHRTAWTSSTQGEPYVPPTVLTPQSPCTATRAVGVGAL